MGREGKPNVTWNHGQGVLWGCMAENEGGLWSQLEDAILFSIPMSTKGVPPPQTLREIPKKQRGDRRL